MLVELPSLLREVHPGAPLFLHPPGKADPPSLSADMSPALARPIARTRPPAVRTTFLASVSGKTRSSVSLNRHPPRTYFVFRSRESDPHLRDATAFDTPETRFPAA